MGREAGILTLLSPSVLAAWLALFGEPRIAPHAHAEVGVVLRQPSLDSPGIDAAVPPAAAAGIGAGIVLGPREAGPRGWLDFGVLTSLGGRAIESLDDGSAHTRPIRSQMLLGSFGVILSPGARVHVGIGLGYALRAFTSPVDALIPAQLIHAPRLIVPLVFTSRRGRVAFRLRPSFGTSVAAAALADRSERDVGLGLGLAVELDVHLVGSLALRLAAREDHDLFFPIHDAQHLATLALVFDANLWTRPRP
jgi:hypothetical protein